MTSFCQNEGPAPNGFLVCPPTLMHQPPPTWYPLQIQYGSQDWNQFDQVEKDRKMNPKVWCSHFNHTEDNCPLGSSRIIIPHEIQSPDPGEWTNKAKAVNVFGHLGKSSCGVQYRLELSVVNMETGIKLEQCVECKKAQERSASKKDERRAFVQVRCPDIDAKKGSFRLPLKFVCVPSHQPTIGTKVSRHLHIEFKLIPMVGNTPVTTTNFPVFHALVPVQFRTHGPTSTQSPIFSPFSPNKGTLPMYTVQTLAPDYTTASPQKRPRSEGYPFQPHHPGGLSNSTSTFSWENYDPTQFLNSTQMQQLDQQFQGQQHRAPELLVEFTDDSSYMSTPDISVRSTSRAQSTDEMQVDSNLNQLSDLIQLHESLLKSQLSSTQEKLLKAQKKMKKMKSKQSSKDKEHTSEIKKLRTEHEALKSKYKVMEKQLVEKEEEVQRMTREVSECLQRLKLMGPALNIPPNNTGTPGPPSPFPAMNIPVQGTPVPPNNSTPTPTTPTPQPTAATPPPLTSEISVKDLRKRFETEAQTGGQTQNWYKGTRSPRGGSGISLGPQSGPATPRGGGGSGISLGGGPRSPRAGGGSGISFSGERTPQGSGIFRDPQHYQQHHQQAFQQSQQALQSQGFVPTIQLSQIQMSGHTMSTSNPGTPTSTAHHLHIPLYLPQHEINYELKFTTRVP